MLRINLSILTAVMPKSSSSSMQHTSRWLDMQLSSDSDLQQTSDKRNSTSTSCIHENQSTALFEDNVNFQTFQMSQSSASNSEDLPQGSSIIQSSWLQLQLSSEDSSEMLSDIGHKKGDPVRSASKRCLDDVDSSDSETSQHHHLIYDDLSDILEEYVQRHGSLSEMEDLLSQSDDDGPFDDYQPGSAEECSPIWMRSFHTDDSAAISEVPDDVESPGK